MSAAAAACPHLSSHFRTPSGDAAAVRPLRALRGCLRVRPLGRPEIRRNPDEHPRCSLCEAQALPFAPPRLYACLACAQVLCPSHAPSHAAAGHEIAVDVDRAELFCCACRDQVYDLGMDEAVSIAQATRADAAGVASVEPKPRKRRRIEYRPWTPVPTELAVLRRRSCQIHGNPAGLRGLNNLGNTCFMNAVLQALLHTPPLRNYFLGDCHNRYICPRRAKPRQKKGSTVCDAPALPPCLPCDLDEVYSAAFCGDRQPYSPAKFLHSWWQHAVSLASYEQQDAHEFFISVLDRIHENIVETQSKSSIHGHGDCCIAHRVFSGILRSDVTCTICGFTSTTHDPCVDIPLDLESGLSSSHNSTAMKMQLNLNAKVCTLMRCLERFTRAERLDVEHSFFCERCKQRQVSLKQMSIRKLPLVSCFHIKRFEHSSAKKVTRKVDQYLQFPFSLDMAPYMSSSIVKSRFGNRLFPAAAAAESGEPDAGAAELSSEFEIFAVITHSGKIDAGHYVTYLRLSNHWYKCDDAWITRVEEQAVRASQAYMLFYVQKTLFYRACQGA